jgi:hypothetical protein
LTDISENQVQSCAASFRQIIDRKERRVLRSGEFLSDLENLRDFANYCNARKIWDKIDEIRRNGGIVTPEEIERMQNEGYI